MIDRLLARPWIALIAALIAHALGWLAMQSDLRAADPLWYAEKGHEIAFHASDLFARHDNFPFVMRLGLTAPIAGMYRLFGVSTLVTNLPCLLAGLAIIAIAYAAAGTPRAKLLAVLFAAVCTPLVADAHELNPDLPCAAAMAASILCLARRDRPHGARWLVAAVAVWFAAFQIKEVALWCAPVWVYAAICDLRERGGRWVARTFAPALAVGALLAAGYLVFCAVLWGDPLARFHGVEDIRHTWSMAGQTSERWAARLVWDPPVMLFKMFRPALVLVVLSPWLVRGRDRIWIAATATIIALYWFGSTSLASYSPLPILRRMILPALPGIVVLSALAADRVLERLRGVRWRLALAAAFAVLLAFPHVQSVRKTIAAIEHPEAAIYAVLRAEVARTVDRIVLVCGDPRCPPLTSFYFEFEPPPNLIVVTVPELVAAPLPAHATVRLLAHVTRSLGVGKPAADRAAALGLPPIVWHREIRLYDAGDGARLRDALAKPP